MSQKWITCEGGNGREWKGEGCSGANYRKQRRSGLTVGAQRREGGCLPHDQKSAENEKKKIMELLDAAKFKDNLLSNFRSPSHELGL